MDPYLVVEAFDVLEYLKSRLFSAGEGLCMNAFGFDDAHEGFGGGVVPRALYCAHRGRYLVVAHGLAEEQRYVLDSMVRVVNAALVWISSRNGHIQSIVRKGGRHGFVHRPADDLSRPCVHHDREVEPPLVGLHIGDVREPRPVRLVRLEVAAYQVRLGVPLRRALLRSRPGGAPAGDANPCIIGHYAGDSFAGCMFALFDQDMVDFRTSVNPPALLIDLADLSCKLKVAPVVCAQPTLSVGVKASTRDI